MTKRIAITVGDANDGELQVADHFGQCSRFFIYEIDDSMQVVKEESYLNPLAGHHGGACELPAYIRNLGAQVIIAGGMGRKAINNFTSFNIEVVTAPGAAVVDAVTEYLKGHLTGYDPCAGHEGGCQH